MTHRRHILIAAAAAAILAGMPAVGAASNYPDKPLRLIVPFAAGGATDVLARLLASDMGASLGQTIIVENKPGASTIIGTKYVADAAPDGYTLLLAGTSTFSVNPVVRSNLPYDSLKSFTPVGQVADMSLVLVAAPETKGTSLKTVLQAAKASNGRYSYGTFGAGSSVHFGAEMLKQRTGIDMLHVPFNGSSPDLTALAGNQVQLSFETVVASLPLIKGGKIKPIAILSAQRTPLLPDVPTIAESGFPGYEVPSWFSLMAPAGLPRPTLDTLAKALETTLQKPEIRQRMTDLGLLPNFAPGHAVTARIQRELPEMQRIAQQASISVN